MTTAPMTYFTAHQSAPSLCRAPCPRKGPLVTPTASAVSRKQHALINATELLLSNEKQKSRSLPVSVARMIGVFACFSSASDSELRSLGLYGCWNLTFAMPKLTQALLMDLDRDGEPYIMSALRSRFGARKWRAHAKTENLLEIALRSIVVPPSTALLKIVTQDSLPSDTMHRYLRIVVETDLRWNRGEPVMLAKWLEVAGQSAYWLGCADSVIKRAVSEAFASPPSPMMIELLTKDDRVYPSLEWLKPAIQLDAKLSHGLRDRVGLFQRWLKCEKSNEWFTLPSIIDSLHDLNLCQSSKYYYRSLIKMTHWPKSICKMIDSMLSPRGSDLPLDRSLHALVFESFNRWGLCPYSISEDQMRLRPWASEKCIPTFTKSVMGSSYCIDDQNESTHDRNDSSMNCDDDRTMCYLAGALMSDAGEKSRRLRSALIRLTLPPKKDPCYRSVVFDGYSLLHSALQSDLELGGGVWHTVLELNKAIDSIDIWNDLCTVAFDSDGLLPIHRAMMHSEPLPTVMIRMLLPNRVLSEELDGRGSLSSSSSLLTMNGDSCLELAEQTDLENGHRVRTRVLLLNELRRYLDDGSLRSQIRTAPVDFARECVRKGMRKNEIESWMLSEGVTVDRASLSVRTALRTSWNAFSV